VPALVPQAALLFDVAGCPNRCRHCWLGHTPNRRAPFRRVADETIREVVRQFRAWERPGSREPFFERLSVATWYREPDFAPNYRSLWALEQELSDEGAAQRFELLSIWRLARDEGYAPWAAEIGTQACQISFFGLEENTDWFCRRRGAFRDSLLATERLIEAGIRPRWQLFLTERLVPELDAFAALVEELDLERRVRALGHEFEVFLHGVCPDGEGLKIEHLRPTVDVLDVLPDYLAHKTMAYKHKETLEACLGRAEEDWLPELREQDAPLAEMPGTLAFMVTPALDVYSNLGEPSPAWRLGSLRDESLDDILGRFERDEAPGLQAMFHVPVSELGVAYGRPESRLLYDRDDLIIRWIKLWTLDVCPKGLGRSTNG
jgi:hypothetical protein